MDDTKPSQDNNTTENSEIEELKQKVAELENNWKRALADYRNLQKRTEEEKDSLINFISAMLFKRFIPVVDNLEILQKHMEDEGLRMIVKDFKQVLSEEGVTEVNPKDQDFDPHTMEAIETVEGPENKVIEVINKGYMLKNKLLRPARVKVGISKEEKAN